MASDEFQDIDSVVTEPDYCHRCGAAVELGEFEEFEQAWCPDCEVVFSRSPVPGAHVVVHDDEKVLVLDEPIPQHEGLLSLPGGYARRDEHPSETAARELEEETGLRADAEDLELLTVIRAGLPDVTFYFITYTVNRSAIGGEVDPEFEDGEVEFVPVTELEANPDRIRDNDLQRIKLAVDR